MDTNTTLVDLRMVRFLQRHHVMTLATCVDDLPHCSNLFYVYLPERNLFVVTSSASTYHGEQLQQNASVAGSVVLESKVIGKLQGVQFRGVMVRPDGGLLAEARTAYLTRFPYAVVMDLELWVIAINYLKMTDNRLGFGKKLIWESTTPPK